MPFDIASLGMGAAQGLIGTGMGLLLEKHNDRRQIAQQQKLTDMQMRAQMHMTNHSYDKQLQMWKDTSYPAQIEMLKKAGLNPGLIYGMGGGGGATTGTAGATGATGGSAPQGGQEIQNNIMGMGILQAKAMEAQIENIQAQTEKTKAETINVPKTGAQIEATTQSLTQGIQNQKAVERLNKIQGDLAEFDKEIKGETLNAAINMAKYQTRLAGEQLTILENEAIISTNTWGDKIDLVKQQLAGSIAQNELTKVLKDKSEAEIQQLSKQLALEYAKLSNEQDKTKIQKSLQEFETSFGGQASNILGQLLQFLPGRQKPK